MSDFQGTKTTSEELDEENTGESTAAAEDNDDYREELMLSLFMHWYGVKNTRFENFEPDRFTSAHMTDLWSKLWFAKGQHQMEVDRELREKYEQLFSIVARADPHEWLTAVKITATRPLSAPILRVLTISCIILFDQIPRNVFRNAARAYATDDFAFILTKKFLEENDFDSLPLPIKISLLLVFIHSERLEDLRVTTLLLSSMEQQMTERFPDVLMSLKQIAENHKIRMERFGRIPERNIFLNRQSTDDEIAVMKSFKF